MTRQDRALLQHWMDCASNPALFIYFASSDHSDPDFGLSFTRTETRNELRQEKVASKMDSALKIATQEEQMRPLSVLLLLAVLAE